MDGSHRDSGALSSAFYTLQLVGGLGLFLLALIAAIFNLSRHPTWFSFCISWTMSSVSYSLLLLAGQTDKIPSFPVCATQSALIYSAPILTGMSTFAMFIYVYFTIHAALTKANLSRIIQLRMLLIIVPYVSWAVFFIAVLILAANKPDYVQISENDYFCNLSTKVPKRISAAIVFIFLTATVVFEAVISIRLFRQWKRLSAVGPKAVNMAIRVLIFGLGAVLAWILTIIYLFPVDVNLSIDFGLAILPVLGLIIFATQGDLYRFNFRSGPGSTRVKTTSSKINEESSVTSVTPLKGSTV
ncbi:hypothetical protein L218DRAFT_305688 [Marasmius fiardii PR-910]|nr:hypothetical protein L218DRAFT_305688 [Marasmius fiardii PR-910]